MNPTVRWPDTSIPTAIYCAPGVLTGLEMMATDGLLAMPRIGLGIGGLLLGRRDAERIEILRSQEIPCSHALGPAFVLTAEEMGLQPPEGEGLQVVGWYCSKTREPFDLTEHDCVLFDTFCPDAWQVALLIRPLKQKVTKAAFLLRGVEGAASAQLGEWMDLAWQELAACEVAQDDPSAPVAAPAALPEPEPITPTPVNETAPVVDQAPVPVAMPTLFGVEDGAVEETRSRWPLRILFALIVLAVLTAGAYFTRDYWMPGPAVSLMASSDWAGRVSILWNPKVLSGENQATLVIDDGSGPVHTIHLTPAETHVGWAQYACRPGTVNITLLAGNLSDTVALKARSESYLPESGISK